MVAGPPQPKQKSSVDQHLIGGAAWWGDLRWPREPGLSRLRLSSDGYARLRSRPGSEALVPSGQYRSRLLVSLQKQPAVERDHGRDGADSKGVASHVVTRLAPSRTIHQRRTFISSPASSRSRTRHAVEIRRSCAAESSTPSQHERTFCSSSPSVSGFSGPPR